MLRPSSKRQHALQAPELHPYGLEVRLRKRPHFPPAQDFVVAVHGRAAKAGAEGRMSPRADIMLSLVLDIKNNKRRDRAGGPAAVLSPGVVAWLKQCRVGQVQLKGLTWEKLLSPKKKVGLGCSLRSYTITSPASCSVTGLGGSLPTSASSNIVMIEMAGSVVTP